MSFHYHHVIYGNCSYTGEAHKIYIKFRSRKKKIQYYNKPSNSAKDLYTSKLNIIKYNLLCLKYNLLFCNLKHLLRGKICQCCQSTSMVNTILFSLNNYFLSAQTDFKEIFEVLNLISLLY